VRISEENAGIIFSNLADNALRHGSTTLEMSASRRESRMLIGWPTTAKASPSTTGRRSSTAFSRRGATAAVPGMGLAIVRAMLDAHGGTIHLVETAHGTAFELNIALADEPASS